jgi:hypothetical protein
LPRSAAPLWKQLSGQDLTPFIQASMRLSGPDENGRYGIAVVAGLGEFCGHTGEGEGKGMSECWTHKSQGRRCEVHEVIRQLYNAARRESVSLPYPKIITAGDGTTQVHFHVTTKTSGRKTVLEQASGDRANLAYDPTATEPKKKKRK